MLCSDILLKKPQYFYRFGIENLLTRRRKVVDIDGD